jgi:hypothetical protein
VVAALDAFETFMYGDLSVRLVDVDRCVRCVYPPPLPPGPV